MILAASSALCRIFTLFLAGSPIYYSAVPKGRCSNCCQINELNDVKFLLYTRRNPFKAKYLYVNDERRLLKSDFNFNHPLAIYLHGFSESASGDGQSSQQIKDAFLKSSNYNVILIDWSPLTTVPWYSNSVENMPTVARFIAQFIRFLLANGYQMNKIHLIGFSLGSALAGLIGKQLRQWGQVLQRITGLDPALPLFEVGSTNRHLQMTDARFVDVIHTDGGLLGNPEPMGHADFYPNDGHAIQPGCARQEIANNRWLGILFGCSHQRAWEYFVESIRSPLAFPATRCETSKVSGRCQYDFNGNAFMGMGANQRLRGLYYLKTNDEPPYGRQISLGQSRRPSTAASAALTDLKRLSQSNNASIDTSRDRGGGTIIKTPLSSTSLSSLSSLSSLQNTTSFNEYIMPTAITMTLARLFDTLINATEMAITTPAPIMATTITINDKIEISEQQKQQKQQKQQRQKFILENNITKIPIGCIDNNNNNDDNVNDVENNVDDININIFDVIVGDNIL